MLLTNFLHRFDKSTCVSLLKKVHRALRPGGRVATLEFVPKEDRVSPPIPAAFSITMLTSPIAGDCLYAKRTHVDVSGGLIERLDFEIPEFDPIALSFKPHVALGQSAIGELASYGAIDP